MIAKREREAAHDRDVTLVWVGEGLRRQKRMPELKTLLTKRELKTQTHQQLKTMLHQLGEHYGLKVRTRKKARRG